MLAFLARLFLIRRLFGGSRQHRRSSYGRGYGRGYGSSYGYSRRRPQSRGGFGMWGPFPTYSTRTRGGSRVSVGGCCLPIPLALSVVLAAGARLLAARR